MSDPSLSSPTQTNAVKAPLEDVMAAMDVVDTLRHQKGIVERELDGEGRRTRLLNRLREMYVAQGIDVPDHVLEEGIDALEQERFKYQAVDTSWQTRLAHIWVTRGRWGKPVGFLAVLGSIFSGVYLVTDVIPERSMRAALPEQLQENLAEIRQVAKNPDVVANAELRAQAFRRAMNQEDYAQAKEVVDDLATTARRLHEEYTIRIVARSTEKSGIWRVPPNNPNGRNYYLIVEAVDTKNKVVAIDVLNQESNTRESKMTWGLRINEETFYRVDADKNDDGIIQGNIVGQKPVGYLVPTFNIATSGATITEW